MTKMKYDIDFQNTVGATHIPNRFHIQRWISSALESHLDKASLCIRIVDKDEIHQLNKKYRSIDKPTNVLSFPFELPEDINIDNNYIGDIVICAEIVFDEATKHNKLLEAHWAHMLIHGTLHLLGYDHVLPEDAEIMELLETTLLTKLGFDDPYRTDRESINE